MPNGSHRRWLQAVDAVRRKLTENLGFVPVMLTRKQLSAYGSRGFVIGWRIGVDFGEPKPRHLDVLLLPTFPISWPRIALVDRPEFLVWPHVEKDGVLCLLSNLTEIDADDPAGVVINQLGNASRLVSDLVAGRLQKDFKEEFLTYWAYDLNCRENRIVSLLRPEGPSRTVRILQLKDLKLVAEDDETIAAWVKNLKGRQPPQHLPPEPAAFIWLDDPLAPKDYPRTGSDVLELAARSGETATAVIASIALSRPDNIIAIIGSEGRSGPGLVAVNIASPDMRLRTRNPCRGPLTRGFRPGRVPPDLLIERYLGQEGVLRARVQRADAEWVHGRGHDARIAKLKQSTVTVFGCGSVGASVAVTLAQAGVGRINLVDYDQMAWANVGRHPLGGRAVGKNKASELAVKLRADYPHARFEAYEMGISQFMSEHIDEVLASNLIVSATVSWQAEAALNDWHVAEDRPIPVLYAWTEANAVAGHAVVVSGARGNLRDGLGRTGVPYFQVASWPGDLSGRTEEPACGVHYQPYGPVELGFVNSMIAQTALDCLLGQVSSTTHRLWICREDLLVATGGKWSPTFLEAYPERTSGGFTAERQWGLDHSRASSKTAA